MLVLLRRQWFLAGMLLVLLAAWALPPLPAGAWQDRLELGLIASIFLASGIAIRTRELGRGLGHWRLHALILGFSLVDTVLICWLLDQLWQALGLDPALRLGLLVLGALPITIASCVALTNAAGGNQTGALVNASLGNLLGVFITPAWILLFAGGSRVDLSLFAVMEKLGLVVLLPLLFGQVLHWFAGHARVDRLRGLLGPVSQVLLLGIVFLGFSAAFAGEGTRIDWRNMTATLGICVLLHGLFLALPWWVSGWSLLELDRADRTAAVICASQKGLALGLPLISLVFADDPDLPLIALPILVYHPLQLIVAAALVPRLAAWNAAGRTAG
ncbi:MAG: bile acid:sodium symporter family protein [Planctomycetota bacterium]